MNHFKELFPFLFPFFFVGMWCFVLRTLSYKSGWTKLADRFYFPGKFDGIYFRFRSGRMNDVAFSSALELGANEQGLYLIPMLLFRLFHKPILIPWSELEAEPFKRFWFAGHRLSFKTFPEISLEIQGNAFEKLLKELKKKTGFQPTASANSASIVE
jgi:hypothetical protein